MYICTADMLIGYTAYFRFEVKLGETEAKFFSHQSEKADFIKEMKQK